MRNKTLRNLCMLETMTLLKHTPAFDAASAVAIAAEYFDVQGSARQLPSERDQNFLLTDQTGGKFVLKIANALESPEFLDAQNSVLKYLSQRVSFCQTLLASSSGEETVIVGASGGAKHMVRLVQYLPGVPFAEIKQHSCELLRDLGGKLGELDRALVDFDHPAAHRDFHWDLANGNRVIEEYGSLIPNTNLRELIFKCRVHFDGHLRRSVIHGDANDYNVLVDPDRMTVVGLIDFGDLVYSYTVGNLAIALAYVVLDKPDPLSSASYVVAGYTQEFPLLQSELEVLWDLVLLRLSMSVCLAAYQQQQQPENRYLEISQRAIAEALPKLARDLRR
jgi:Ser/Thr protein kinase RdoA (MazF antagonist)